MKEEKKSQNNKERKIELTIQKEISKGQYSNLALSNFSKDEFILDFALIQPHNNKADINSRVILSPRNAKNLLTVLQKNIEDYEKKWGPISDTPPKTGGISMSFN